MLIGHTQRTSAYFAAMVNAAAAHMVEPDDLHNSSVFHPACVVFPPALAVMQERAITDHEVARKSNRNCIA